MQKTKTALITGAGGTIGRAIAEHFAKNGYRLFLSGRSSRELSAFAKQLVKGGASAVALRADVANEKSVKRLMQGVAKRSRSLDVLVTAAGTYGEIGPLATADMKRWRSAFDVNALGTALSIKYALPLLKKSKDGSVICFAGGGEGPLRNFTAYAASKGAVLRLVESLAEELKPHGISVNAISPGLVKSGLTRELIAAGPKRAGKEKYVAAQREAAGEAETVSPNKAAELALFLASPSVRDITGKNISAAWDNWQEFPKHISEIAKSDVYTWRRIKPKDRNHDWK